VPYFFSPGAGLGSQVFQFSLHQLWVLAPWKWFRF